ncbi:MAG: hypothetical protein LH650_15290 [Chloroflexi bacterium]|nr:hypothetical protein [Chloroflexota bacterium]
MLVADIRAGLANGSMARGTVVRVASGMGMTPIQGDILTSEQVTAVSPPLAAAQIAAAWEVIERPKVDASGWSASVIGIRAR